MRVSLACFIKRLKPLYKISFENYTSLAWKDAAEDRWLLKKSCSCEIKCYLCPHAGCHIFASVLDFCTIYYSPSIRLNLANTYVFAKFKRFGWRIVNCAKIKHGIKNVTCCIWKNLVVTKLWLFIKINDKSDCISEKVLVKEQKDKVLWDFFPTMSNFSSYSQLQLANETNQ